MKGYSIIVLILAIFFSCKKEKNDSVPNNQPLTSPNPNTIYGLLRYSKLYSTAVSSPILSTLGYNSKVFFASAKIINNELESTALEATQVNLNGTIFKKENGTPVYYWDTSFAISVTSSLPQNWQITGKGILPSFSFVNYGAYPVYTGWNVLPDSVDINQNVIVSLQGVSGADEVEVYFSTYGDTSAIKVVSAAVTSVTFTPADLANMITVSSGFIAVNCYKNDFGLFNNRTYKFQIGCCTYKTGLKIKN